MDRDQLRALLEAVKRGEAHVDDALETLARPTILEVPDARVDTHRALRAGIPEVIYAPGKTAKQIIEIARALQAADQSVLATRVDQQVAEEIRCSPFDSR